MVEEARLEANESGLAPTTEGWFVVNVRDTTWATHETFGSDCMFESPNAEFSELGIRICVLLPGQPNGLYHGEETQEDFLVLAGECLLLVEGEERRLQARSASSDRRSGTSCPGPSGHSWAVRRDVSSAVAMCDTGRIL